MYDFTFLIVIAHLAATGSALLLAKRGPTRRLKLLTMTVGLLSLTLTVNTMQLHGGWTIMDPKALQVQQLLVCALSLLSIYLLGREILDRSYTDCRLRLVEHEVEGIATAIQPAVSAQQLATEPAVAQPMTFELEHMLQASDSTSRGSDLINLANAVSAEQPVASESVLKATREVELAVGAIHVSATNVMNLYFYKTLNAR